MINTDVLECLLNRLLSNIATSTSKPDRCESWPTAYGSPRWGQTTAIKTQGSWAFQICAGIQLRRWACCMLHINQWSKHRYEEYERSGKLCTQGARHKEELGGETLLSKIVKLYRGETQQPLGPWVVVHWPWLFVLGHPPQNKIK